MNSRMFIIILLLLLLFINFVVVKLLICFLVVFCKLYPIVTVDRVGTVLYCHCNKRPLFMQVSGVKWLISCITFASKYEYLRKKLFWGKTWKICQSVCTVLRRDRQIIRLPCSVHVLANPVGSAAPISITMRLRVGANQYAWSIWLKGAARDEGGLPLVSHSLSSCHHRHLCIGVLFNVLAILCFPFWAGGNFLIYAYHSFTDHISPWYGWSCDWTFRSY
jgi:hypothetical protein